MQTIQIENDIYSDILKYGIDIQTELKQVIAKFLEKKESYSYLNSKEFQKDKAHFQQCLEDIESGKTKTVSHDEMWKEIKSY
ncbi:hypothetical protein GSY74_05200 [Sulfurovum sp. bin170]|uniref:hypothetical protein n=1 Tax=Sulfurovum sp. bin170 TaxID=2695268 RepID=UPI0013DFF293|nr:hypothetical protein [Sulfurovum sp. bin170]NEW60674.1 hypothetical protein [Sulfurovum sp. bin170]